MTELPVSSIPTSAIPHARVEPNEAESSHSDRLRSLLVSGREWVGGQYGTATRAVRREPGIAIAAGVATVAAALAAVFVPRLWRRRSAVGL